MSTSDSDASIAWSWSSFPGKVQDGARTVVPLGCLYTPLAPSPRATHWDAAPVRCGCGALYNGHCAVSQRHGTWACVFCGRLNACPGGSPARTVEYRRGGGCGGAVVLVVDLAVGAGELALVRGLLLRAAGRLGAGARVALVTFGATVNVHDLRGADPARSTALRGAERPSLAQCRRVFGPGIGRVVAPLAGARAALAALVRGLEPERWPTPRGRRPPRATGAAIGVAACLLEIAGGAGAILPFVSGACTEGPGRVVDADRAALARTHADIAAHTPTHLKAATDYYDALTTQLVTNGHTLCMVSASLDQVGTFEMRNCIHATGGCIISTDLWSREWIDSSIEHFLKSSADKISSLNYNVSMEVITTSNWKVSGVIGPCLGTGKRSQHISSVETGIGGTCEWVTSCMSPTTTFGIYFEASEIPSNQANLYHNRYAQILTKYQTSDGTSVIQATTIEHPIFAGSILSNLAPSFNSEVAAVLIARLAIYKTEQMPLKDVMQWLDRLTIRFVSRFSSYTLNQPNTLKLAPALALFPVFMYHLRRSGYLNVLNQSPDETAVLRLLFLKSKAEDAIIMIQPTLMQYSLSSIQTNANGSISIVPTPASLEESSIPSDGIILLDTYFEVLIIRGDTLNGWIQQGYNKQAEYSYIDNFIALARKDAMDIVNTRTSTPRYFEINRFDGNFRIFKNRVNPSQSTNSVNSQNESKGGDELTYTDDISLQNYMKYLKKLVVQQA